MRTTSSGSALRIVICSRETGRSAARMAFSSVSAGSAHLDRSSSGRVSP
jgi:hypothetical protein